MKSALASAALLVLGCVSASAADLGARPYTKAPAVVDVGYNWTGFYIGGHAGYAWAPASYTHNETAGVGGAIVTSVGYGPEPAGFTGGAQVGYQYQFSNRFVVGVEGAYSWFDQSASAAVIAAPPRTRATTVGDIWSVAGRLGYAFGASLLYVKGGYANSELKFSNTLNATGAVLGQSSTRVDGFVVGTGLEYGFARNWSVAGEYNYYGFDVGRQQQALGGVAVAAYNDAIDFNIHQVLVKLNYRFGG
ncbi:outer membrane beta-barrel protein [Bradyrhizobium sp. LjRoot220]|uniref:outer membrane protein n=1 Tax=Bradyrhizobium sp. LjRoot220 TaxID=3342284 RepID=UPI003ECC944D